jgi:hypothetical protein
LLLLSIFSKNFSQTMRSKLFSTFKAAKIQSFSLLSTLFSFFFHFILLYPHYQEEKITPNHSFFSFYALFSPFCSPF